MIDLRRFILIDGLDDEINFANPVWYSRQLEPDATTADQLIVSTVTTMLRDGEIDAVGNFLMSDTAWRGTPEEIGDRLRDILALPNVRSDERLTDNRNVQVAATWLITSPATRDAARAFWREHREEWDDLFDEL